MDGIDAVDLTRRQAVAATGGGQEFTIEAEPVVGDERGLPCPLGELAEHLLWPGRIGDLAISHSGITLDEGGNRPPGPCVTGEGVIRAQASCGESHGGDLDELILLRIQPGGF